MYVLYMVTSLGVLKYSFVLKLSRTLSRLSSQF